jgi:hypothetical protein
VTVAHATNGDGLRGVTQVLLVNRRRRDMLRRSRALLDAAPSQDPWFESATAVLLRLTGVDIARVPSAALVECRSPCSWRPRPSTRRDASVCPDRRLSWTRVQSGSVCVIPASWRYPALSARRTSVRRRSSRPVSWRTRTVAPKSRTLLPLHRVTIPMVEGGATRLRPTGFIRTEPALVPARSSRQCV